MEESRAAKGIPRKGNFWEDLSHLRRAISEEKESILRRLLEMLRNHLFNFRLVDATKVVQFRHRPMFHKVVGKSEAHNTGGNTLICQEF